MAELHSMFLQFQQLLPLFVLFTSGYIIYRLLACHKITEHIAIWFIRRSGGRVPVLLFLILVATTVLSFFISNAIAVLTLLPILKTIRNDFVEMGYEKKKITTVLTIPLMYGANIGGMGSLIGGPAHIILLGSLELMDVAGREQISFGSWFFWSLPLTVLFIITTWLIVIGIATTDNFLKARISLDKLVNSFQMDARQNKVMGLFIGFIIFWTAQAVFSQLFQFGSDVNSVIALVFLAFFIYFIFLRREKMNGKKPYLKLRDLIIGVPPKAFLLLGIIIAIAIGIRFFAFDVLVVNFFEFIIGPNAPIFVVFLIVIFTVMILTEIFSNSIVATAVMPVAFALSNSLGISPLALMIGVSAGCTCSFMTPIATPSNALAFAEMDGISLRRLLLWGMLMNILGAILLSGYLPIAISFVYGN